MDLGHQAHLLPCSPTTSPPQNIVLSIRAGNPASTTILSARLISAVRACSVRTTSNITTDRGRAPQVRHTSPLLYVEVLYLFQYLRHLFPPPSELSLGRAIRRLDRIEIVDQSVVLTVELFSTIHGSTLARTWIGRNPRPTLLGHPRISGDDDRDGLLLVGISRSLHHCRSP